MGRVTGTAPGGHAVALCWGVSSPGRYAPTSACHDALDHPAPVPAGDRGGTRFYIQARAGAHTALLAAEWRDIYVGEAASRDLATVQLQLCVRGPHIILLACDQKVRAGSIKTPGEISHQAYLQDLALYLLTLPINLSQHNVQAAHNGYGISHERALADRA